MLLALLAGCTLPTRSGDSADRPIDTTITTIRADGPQYNGKYVRVRGLLNQCSGFSCVLHPVSSDGKPDSAAGDLRLSFSHDVPTLRMPEPVDPSRVRDALAFLYRFSEITVVGRYEYACDSAFDTHAKPKPGGTTKSDELEEVVVCTDAATNFYDVAVIAVHRRWPSTAFARDDADKLISLSPAVTGSIAATYRAFMGFGSWNEKEQYRAFVGSFDDAAAFFCVCLEKDCTGRWPTERPHLPGNPMNPYTCTYAKRADGVWRFEPSFDR